MCTLAHTHVLRCSTVQCKLTTHVCWLWCCAQGNYFLDQMCFSMAHVPTAEHRTRECTGTMTVRVLLQWSCTTPRAC